MRQHAQKCDEPNREGKDRRVPTGMQTATPTASKCQEQTDLFITESNQPCSIVDSSPLFVGQHFHLVIAVEHDFAVLLIYKLTICPRASEGLENGSSILIVVLSQYGFHSLGGFLGVVEGHLGEEMMHDMSVTNVVVQNVVDTIVAVDGAQGTAHKSECLRGIVRNGRVRVLQVGDEDEPAIDKHVRNEVVLQDCGNAKYINRVEQGGECGDETKVRDDDVPVLSIGEHDGSRVEVVCAFSIVLA